jgi:O-antigen chain-terminating methyltransferase
MAIVSFRFSPIRVDSRVAGSQREYYEFMGYSSDALRDRYTPYADKFAGQGPVADLGCGRGEFLELLKQRGIDALGVDADEEMVEAVKAKGLNAVKAEVHDFLRSNPGKFRGVFAAHLIEHLKPEDFAELTRLAAGALQPGGRLILVTPNPRNLSMHLYEFWTDLQHVRFYTPEIAKWVVHQAGFRDVETGENPKYESNPRVSDFAYVLGPPPTPITLRSKLKRRFVDWLLPSWILQMRDIVRSLYPPAEFFVTGIR